MEDFDTAFKHLQAGGRDRERQTYCKRRAGRATAQLDSGFCSIHFGRDTATADAAAASKRASFSRWRSGPIDPSGRLLDASDRPLLCSALREREVVVGGADHGLRVYDIDRGVEVRNLFSKSSGHTEWVTCVAFAHDGRIISGGMDKVLCLWARRGSRCDVLRGHAASVSAVKTTDTGGHCVSASYDKTLRVWDLTKSAEAAVLRGHSAPVLDFCISGSKVMSGDRSGVAMVWDLSHGKESRKIGGHNGHITSLDAIGSDGNLWCTGDQAGVVRLFDARSDRPSMSAATHNGGAVNALRCCADRGSSVDGIASAGADKRMFVLDMRKGLEPLFEMRGHADFIYSMEIFGDIVLSGAGNGMLLTHSLRDSGELLYGLGANGAGVRCIEASHDKLIAAGDDGKAIVYAM